MPYHNLMYALNSDPNPTEGKVLHLLNAMHQHKHEAQTAMPIAQFWKPGDLAAFEQAVAWWPKDAPPIVQRPMLGELCHAMLRTEGQPALSFNDYLTMRGQRCAAWLKQEGRNVQNPNETKEERKRRMGREAQARYRTTAKKAEADPAVAEVKRLWQVYIETCTARKAAIAAVNAQHDQIVKDAHAAWEEAKAALSAPSSSGDPALPH